MKTKITTKTRNIASLSALVALALSGCGGHAKEAVAEKDLLSTNGVLTFPLQDMTFNAVSVAWWRNPEHDGITEEQATEAARKVVEMGKRYEVAEMGLIMMFGKMKQICAGLKAMEPDESRCAEWQDNQNILVEDSQAKIPAKMVEKATKEAEIAAIAKLEAAESDAGKKKLLTDARVAKEAELMSVMLALNELSNEIKAAMGEQMKAKAAIGQNPRAAAYYDSFVKLGDQATRYTVAHDQALGIIDANSDLNVMGKFELKATSIGPQLFMENWAVRDHAEALSLATSTISNGTPPAIYDVKYDPKGGRLDFDFRLYKDEAKRVKLAKEIVDLKSRRPGMRDAVKATSMDNEIAAKQAELDGLVAYRYEFRMYRANYIETSVPYLDPITQTMVDAKQGGLAADNRYYLKGSVTQYSRDGTRIRAGAIKMISDKVDDAYNYLP